MLLYTQVLARQQCCVQCYASVLTLKYFCIYPLAYHFLSPCPATYSYSYSCFYPDIKYWITEDDEIRAISNYQLHYSLRNAGESQLSSPRCPLLGLWVPQFANAHTWISWWVHSRLSQSGHHCKTDMIGWLVGLSPLTPLFVCIWTLFLGPQPHIRRVPWADPEGTIEIVDRIWIDIK